MVHIADAPYTCKYPMSALGNEQIAPHLAGEEGKGQTDVPSQRQ